MPMVAANTVTLVFLGCGDGVAEAAIVRELVRRCHLVRRVVFMDRRRHQRLVEIMDEVHTDTNALVEYLDSYASLEGRVREWASTTTLVPVGYNNALRLETASELWSCWRFFVTCESILAADPNQWSKSISCDYVNILDNTDCTYDRFPYPPFGDNGELAIVRYGWFEYASTIIGSRGAKALLTSPKTPPRQPVAETDRNPNQGTCHPAEQHGEHTPPLPSRRPPCNGSATCTYPVGA